LNGIWILILAYGFEPFVRKGVTGLDISDMTSIPRAIYQLKEKYIDKYLLLENAFIQLFPNIKKIFLLMSWNLKRQMGLILAMPSMFSLTKFMP
jgi:hypothetical protein